MERKIPGLTLLTKRWLSILPILFCISPLASADNTLIVGGHVTGTTLTIQDSALTALNSGWANGVGAYIDPYHGTLNGQAVLLFCVDPDHLDNTSPTGYAVTISPNGSGSSTLQELNLLGGGVIPSSGSLSKAAIAAGFTSASQLYGGLAWLSTKLQDAPDTLTQQEYQAAIWQLADYTSTFAVINPPSGFNSSQVTTFEDQAQANSGALAGNFEVLTDSSEATNGKNAGQEYLVFTTPPPQITPEPSAVLLSLSGFIGVIVLRRRRVLP